MTNLTDVVESTAIRPFQVSVPEAEFTDLRRRILATRLPESETVTDFSQGVGRSVRGGHFAAWEQPKFLSEEMRAGFRTLRK